MTAAEGAHLQKDDRLLFESGQRSLCVSAPGSCANLGPGFDTLAIAVDLRCSVKLSLSSRAVQTDKRIILEGRAKDGIATSDNNLVLTILNRFWPLDSALLPRLQLTIGSDIPTGRGLGSSAAATICALNAAEALALRPVDAALVLRRAQELEGHADNACASLLGGLTTTCRNGNGAIEARKIAWPEKWQLIATVPNYQLSTKKARSVLPAMVPMSDAVANLQRLSLLLWAAANEDDDSLRQALTDRLHEPYRADLVPELRQVRRLLADLPALGTVLSGAGSSILSIVNRRHANQVVDHLQTWAAAQKQPPMILPLRVSTQGVACEWQ